MVTVAAAVEEVAAAAALITYETCTSAFSLTHWIKTRPTNISHSFLSCFFKVFATPQQPMTTPLMTPSYSYTTPGQQQTITTPQYPSSTPQSSHGHHQHSSSTPSSSSSRVRTPQPKWVLLLLSWKCKAVRWWIFWVKFFESVVSIIMTHIAASVLGI